MSIDNRVLRNPDRDRTGKYRSHAVKSSREVITDVTAYEWYALRYAKCLKKYGPDSVVTIGYREILQRIDRDVTEEMTLEVHYASDCSRPLDISN